MINASSSSLFVYDQERDSYLCLENDELRRELCDAFEYCSVGATWMVDCILQALPEKLRASREAGKHLTKDDVRMLLSSALDASGFTDVSRAFMEKPCLQKEPNAESEIAKEPQEPYTAWTPLSLTSTVRYISSDKWNLDLSESTRRLLSARIISLQSVSDVLPLAVVQCRLGRMWDIPEHTPTDEEDFVSRLPAVSEAVTECISQMRIRIGNEWNGIQQGIPVVRIVDFGMLSQLLGVKKSRAARQETETRLKEKLNALFENHDFKIKTQFG